VVILASGRATSAGLTRVSPLANLIGELRGDGMPGDSKVPAAPTILVVDDDAAFLHSLKLLLEVNGYGVTTAENGVRGLQAFRNTGPDIVLIDVNMPKLSGVETIRQMRRERPEAKIIVMSGGLENRDLPTAARELGASAAIEKPFDPDALTKLLADLLRPDATNPAASPSR
jgi:DNA-binding response OmpR family regulator